MRRSLFLLAPLLAFSSPVLAAPVARAAASQPARAAEVSALIRSAMAQPKAAATGGVASLIARAQKETDPALQKMAVTALLKIKLPLLRAQKKDILALVRDKTRGLLPKAPPVAQTGAIEVPHFAMEGFYAADVAALKKVGFQVTQGAAGGQAKLGRLTINLRESSKDVLAGLNNTNPLAGVYTGHSQIGGTVEQALQQPGLRAPTRRKLLCLFQCVGTQTLPLIKAKAAMAEVITSNAPLYVDEIPGLIGQLYLGIEKGENYQQIARRMEKTAWEKGRLVLPNQTASLKHVDFDGNGELDINQKPGDIELLPAAASARATALMSGVHFLRTLNPYYADETPGAVFSRAHAKIPVISIGIEPGDGKSVTHVTERVVDGQRQFEVSLDPKFKDASPRFIGAAAVYELQMHLQKSLIGKDDARAKARALAFAGEYLELMPRDAQEGQAALTTLAAMKGLPKLSMWSMQSALAGGHILSEDQVTKVEKLIATGGR